MATKLNYECSSDYLKHRENILELHRRNYGKVSEKFYDSLYLGNPYGDPLLGLCFDEQKLIGQENYIRQNVASDGLIYRSAIGINTIVDPNYRLFYSVFKELIKLTMDKMKEDTDILCAFANEESKKYYIKYFNWKVSTKVQVYKKVIGYSGVSTKSFLALLRPGKLSKDFSLREVTEFDPIIINEILNNHVKLAKYCYFYKTAEFLNWKFLRNKHYKLTGYLIEYKGDVCGYVVTYDDDVELKITDFVIDKDDIEVFEKTVSSLAYIGSQKGKKHLVIYATPNCWYMKALKKRFLLNDGTLIL